MIRPDPCFDFHSISSSGQSLSIHTCKWRLILMQKNVCFGRKLQLLAKKSVFSRNIITKTHHNGIWLTKMMDHGLAVGPLSNLKLVYATIVYLMPYEIYRISANNCCNFQPQPWLANIFHFDVDKKNSRKMCEDWRSGGFCIQEIPSLSFNPISKGNG